MSFYIEYYASIFQKDSRSIAHLHDSLRWDSFIKMEVVVL